MQAVEMGRKMQKKETGLIHIDERIPLLENALFALSLFRTRLSDNVLEGKALIRKILAFEKEGSFPCFLHEYPDCLDPYLGLRLLPIFFFIIEDFPHVIGDLKEALEESMKRITQKASTSDLPAWAVFRMEAMIGKIGPLPNTVYEWGLALISLQIAEKKGADIESAIAQATHHWHPELGMYIGPNLQRHQDGYFPMTSVFDLFMNNWQKASFERIHRVGPILLYQALIYPLSFEPTFSEKRVPFVDFEKRGETPLFIAWKKHSFVFAKQHTEVSGNAENLEITLPTNLPTSDFMEVNFFLDHHEDHELLVNGKKSTTFKMGDFVEIVSKGASIQLQFTAEGGAFFGHILRGNRPSQHACKGEDQFTAFDWRISIRTVSRESEAILRAQVLLTGQEQESLQPHPSHASHYPHTASSL